MTDADRQLDDDLRRVPLPENLRAALTPEALFADAGGTWDSGSGPDRLRRSVGVELLADTRLLYALDWKLRLGVARALDGPQQTRWYFTAGRAF